MRDCDFWKKEFQAEVQIQVECVTNAINHSAMQGEIFKVSAPLQQLKKCLNMETTVPRGKFTMFNKVQMCDVNVWGGLVTTVAMLTCSILKTLQLL